jgi:hypothetical protein
MSQIIRKAAELRSQGNFDAAISLVEQNLATIDPDVQVVALLQAFYAAVEGKYTSKAKELAQKLVALEPQLPSIQQYL